MVLPRFSSSTGHRGPSKRLPDKYQTNNSLPYVGRILYIVSERTSVTFWPVLLWFQFQFVNFTKRREHFGACVLVCALVHMSLSLGSLRLDTFMPRWGWIGMDFCCWSKERKLHQFFIRYSKAGEQQLRYFKLLGSQPTWNACLRLLHTHTEWGGTSVQPRRDFTWTCGVSMSSGFWLEE